MRVRIVRLTVLAAMLATTVFGICAAIAVAGYLVGDEQRELQEAATRATLAVSADLVHGIDPAELPKVGRPITIGLYTVTGRRIAGQGPATADAPVRAALADPQHAAGQSLTSHGDLVAVVTASDNETIIGVVRAAEPKTAVYLNIALAWLAIAAVGAAAVTGSWLLARRQAGTLSRPLEQLAELAQRLGDGDFSIQPEPSRVPEIDAAGSALASTAHRLGDLVDRERAFTANASHQLRTPLTSLRLGLDAALDRCDTADDPRPALTAAIESAERLDRTINDLIQLARDAPDHQQPVNPLTTVDELLAHWPGGPQRPLRVTVIGTPPPCRISAAALRQILNVLLDNALHHGTGGVTIIVRQTGSAVAIDVTDEGTLPAATIDDLVERRCGTGHGIGLSLARSLAEAENGRLHLTSRNPTTFTLLLAHVQRSHGQVTDLSVT